MALVDELKAKWTCTLVALDNTQNRAAELQIELADLDKAISALTPKEDSGGLFEHQPSGSETGLRQTAGQDAADDDWIEGDDEDDQNDDEDDQIAEDREEVCSIVTAIPGGMILWTSGECPVDPATNIIAVYADHGGKPDRFHVGDGVAGEMNWNGTLHNNAGDPQSPVIAYHVLDDGAPISTPTEALDIDDTEAQDDDLLGFDEVGSNGTITTSIAGVSVQEEEDAPFESIGVEEEYFIDMPDAQFDAMKAAASSAEGERTAEQEPAQVSHEQQHEIYDNHHEAQDEVKPERHDAIELIQKIFGAKKPTLEDA